MTHPLKETTLADNAPVTAGKVYIIDGKPRVATVTGLVSDLKTAIGGSPVIKSVDLVGRSPGWLDDALGA